MLQLPLRPLVPLSALALLGWCWYTFRKKRDLYEGSKEQSLVSFVAGKQSMVENVVIQEAAANESSLAAQDTKTHCHFQSQVQKGDQNLDGNCSQLSSTVDDSSVSSGASQFTVLTSTPVVQHVKGIRPEPEGQVSRTQAFLLLAEKTETELEKEDDIVKGHSDFKAIETESFVQQPTGIVCPKEHDVTNVSENPSLSEADGLVVEVISGAQEEIAAIGGGILKRKDLVGPSVTPETQVQVQKEIDENNSLAVTKKSLDALTKTVEESVSLAHKPSDPSSTFLTQRDSGCSTCLSEDTVDAEKAPSKSKAVEKTSSTVSVSSETHYSIARKNGKLSRQTTDTSKG